MAKQTQPSAPESALPPATEMPTILGLVAVQIQNDVLEYNNARGPQFMVGSRGNTFVQVIPNQPPLTTAVIEIDRDGVISVVCPPAGLGVGRHGKFREVQGRIVSLGNFVGSPQPGDPMSVQEFSRFVLEPILFPSAN